MGDLLDGIQLQKPNLSINSMRDQNRRFLSARARRLERWNEAIKFCVTSGDFIRCLSRPKAGCAASKGATGTLDEIDFDLFTTPTILLIQPIA